MYYIITDPCYIISNENWKKIFDPLDLNDPDFFPKAKKGIEEELNKIGKCLGVADTGDGDWINKIYRTADFIEVIKREFFADAGLVCVVEVDDFTKYHIYGAAIVRSERPLTCKMDRKNHHWTVVRLYDEDGRQVLRTNPFMKS